MAAKRIAAWFLTESGKKFSYLFAGTATTVVMCAHYLPHTILIEQYKYVLHSYRKGMTVPLSEKIKKRFDKALDLLEVKPEEKFLYQPFAGLGFDIFSAGTDSSKFGVIVGIPPNFEFDRKEDIDQSRIKVNLESVVWDLDEGQALLDSLVLSENAQLYAMAKEIKYRQTPKVLLDTVFGTMCTMTAYFLGHTINQRYNFYAKPLPARLIIYMFVGLLQLGTYFTAVDMTQIYYEKKIDKELKKNPLFEEGGKEFYQKVLAKNKALRKLMGKEGEVLYSVLGNENYFLRTKHWPLVHRKAFFEGTAKEMAA